MRRMIFLATSILVFGITFSLSASPSFSGKAGIKSDIQSDSTSDYCDPTMTLQSFFSGQFDFSNNLIFRTELSMETADILENGIYEDIDAKFKVDELSLTKHFLLGNFSNFVSLFAGTYEPIGSDIFLRRYFGIEPIDSKITQSWQGIKDSTVLPFYGVGGSYIVKMNIAPIALGTFAYVNHQNTDKYELNGDLRFACVSNNFCIDMAGGIGAPLKSEDSNGEESFLVIDELYLHGGLEMLIGNIYSGAIFTEAGIQNVKYTKIDGGGLDFSADNVFLIVEPRLVFNHAKLCLGFFSLPQETVDSLFFVDDSLGINGTFYTDSIHIKNGSIETGLHLTYSWPNKNLSDLSGILSGDTDSENDEEDNNFKVSPFITVKTKSGELQTMLQIITTDLADKWEQAVKINIGYKTCF